jgi:DNA repair exonuclease SbcCD ATPase subunit
MPDEEFNVLGEDELALLTRRFERLHENWVNVRRNTRTCFQCGKPGHFVADCLEKVENKDGYKHKSMMEGKYRSRRDHKSKHKNKHKDERRSRKKESRGKARVMVGASDVDSSSAYSTSSSSSSEDEGYRCNNKNLSKNLSRLSYFARYGFCTMALSYGSKKSTQSDYSDSDDEVRDELPFLRQENERLGSLIDNRDDMLREAKKMRKELRASLEDARTRVAELETHVLDSKLEIDSLKASPVVSNEVDCADCSIFLAHLALFKEKHTSKCEELDVLRVEVAELKSISALLGACTSCPVLHAKIDEMHAYTVSLEAKLKEPIPTSCSTCEMQALKNLELSHYVERLQDENDELRKLMGWLSGHEPQLRIMIETFKRQDGEGLGANKVGEGSGENIPEPPKTHHKNDFPLKPNNLRN